MKCVFIVQKTIIKVYLSIFIFTVLTLCCTKNLLDEELHVDGVVLGVVLVVVDIGMGWDYGRNYLDGDVHEEMR